MKSYFDQVENRWHHRFRQSWIKSADLCPERGRLEHLDLMEDKENDAACVGTSVHTAIEVCLGEHHAGAALDLATTIEVQQDAFTELMAQPTFTWVKYTEASARKFGETCIRGWHREVLPTLPDKALLEVPFQVVLEDDENHLIELSGTADYDGDILRDWKTSGRGPFVEWEHRRWAIQPTIYTYALRSGREEPIPFEFVVMHANGVQRFTVWRDESDFEWLRMKARSWAALIEADLEVWPRNDTHALCSPTWCPAWKNCKGKSYPDGDPLVWRKK